jgi:hypothetical protein
MMGFKTMNSLKKRRLAVGGFFFLTGLCFSSWASRIPDFQVKFSLSEGQLGSLLLGMPLGSLLALRHRSPARPAPAPRESAKVAES